MTDRKLILASASPRRRELLGLLGIPFEIVPSAYEEVMPERHPDPATLAVHLASEKARDVARIRPGEWVLGADTIVVLGNRLYGKPVDMPDACWMLQELSGNTHQVVTGVCLIGPDGVEHPLSAATDVRFRELLDTEIAAYVATGEPLDKAGAYAIQGIGGLLIERISGDYPNVVGLPITPLALLLRRCGFPILRVGV
jgi:septum formation protein